MLKALWSGKTLPVLVVSAILIGLWYVGAILLNGDMQRDAFANANNATYTFSDLVIGTWSQERPKLPAPDQILAELQKTVIDTAPTSKRSLVYHGTVTLSATLLGFLIGSALGMVLAILVVSILGPSLTNTIVAVSVVYLPNYVRLVR
ncbi:MAG: ABC transporter permease, partial [Alphaproteobacteria bacterium]|nr:ABC transporter permease [Alphaproteobacteria bacterium]